MVESEEKTAVLTLLDLWAPFGLSEPPLSLRFFLASRTPCSCVSSSVFSDSSPSPHLSGLVGPGAPTFLFSLTSFPWWSHRAFGFKYHLQISIPVLSSEPHTIICTAYSASLPLALTCPNAVILFTQACSTGSPEPSQSTATPFF